MKKVKLLSLLLAFVMLLTACGGNDSSSGESTTTSEGTSETQEGGAEEHGELVPSITILSSLPEANMVNHEMAKELAKEMEAIGIEANASPTDFAVIIDTIYGEDPDFDMYTIGWSGRVERLDPDMFIHSINHSINAEDGGNNTDKYRNPEFDKIADEQRSEMDPEKRKELVFEAQRILAEDVPRITIYSRDIVQAYNKDKFSNPVNMVGEGLFNEWMPITIEPTTDDKVLKVASSTNIDTLNPLNSNTVYEWRNLRLIYDKLLRTTKDVELQGSAAESWNVVDDTTIDVVLRSGMTFHDGNPVTVEDVKYTYDLMIEHAPYFKSFLDPIESVEIIDDNTVRFNLKFPTASFLSTALTQIPILPKHVWEAKEDVKTDTNDTPIGSGPFVFQHFRPGEELMAERFDDYHTPAKIDGYIFKIYGTPEGILTALELQDVDMISHEMIPAHIEMIENNEGGVYDHLEVTAADDIGFFYFGMKTDKPPFDNKQFRIALSYLVDYDLAVDVYLNGLGSRGGGGLVISKANTYWQNPDVPIYDEYNPEKAKEILTEAGFTWDDEGRLRMPKE